MYGIDGYGEEQDSPHYGASAGDYHAFAIVRGGTPSHVEIYDCRRGERIERRAEVRHCGGEDGSHEQSRYTRGHFLDDEPGEEAVATAGTTDRGQSFGMHSVEDEQACSDQQEES